VLLLPAKDYGMSKISVKFFGLDDLFLVGFVSFDFQDTVSSDKILFNEALFENNKNYFRR